EREPTPASCALVPVTTTSPPDVAGCCTHPTASRSGSTRLAVASRLMRQPYAGGRRDMEFREVLETTGTCRFYRPDPIPDDVLRPVLDGTGWAPPGGNRQGVRFVFVRDAAKRRQLRDLYVPLWEQYSSRATVRPGAPLPRLLANADHMAKHL